MNESTRTKDTGTGQSEPFRPVTQFLLGMMVPPLTVVLGGALVSIIVKYGFLSRPVGWDEAVFGGMLITYALVAMAFVGVTLKALQGFDWKRRNHIAQAAGLVLSMILIGASFRIFVHFH